MRANLENKKTIINQVTKIKRLKYIEYRYIIIMINNFSSKTAQDIFDGVSSKFARKIDKKLYAKITRLFDQLNAVLEVEELRSPPGNRLEKLKGDLKDFWSLRVNDQYRIIFKWRKGVAFDVDIIDYH